MPKIPNWSRKRSAEDNPATVYHWENDNSGNFVLVETAVDGGYVLSIYQAKIVKDFDSKEKARKEAVNWMENNPDK